ncbi:MAG: hypothetical protein ACRCVW_04700 [Brevinema sp.]
MKILFFILIFFSTSLYAFDREDRIYRDAASMGMGGVGVSTSGYAFSPIHNPAALGLMADYDIVPFITLGFGFDPNLTKTATTVFSPNPNSSVQSSLVELQGPLSLGYFGKGFGIWTTSAARVHFDTSAPVTDIPIGSAKIRSTIEITLNLAYGYKIPFKGLDNVSGLSFGATLRFAQRFRQHAEFETASLSDILLTKTPVSTSAALFSGSSISSDFGMSLRIQNWILGVAVRDAFSTGYNWNLIQGSGSQPFSKIPFSVDFGTSYQFIFNNAILQHIALFLEFEDSANTSISWLDKMRVGSEIKMFQFLSLRLGIYDAFVTGGIGMNWKWGRIDFAYYRDNFQQEFRNQDRFHISATVGLENTPERKKTAQRNKEMKKKLSEQKKQLINNSIKDL